MLHVQIKHSFIHNANFQEYKACVVTEKITLTGKPETPVTPLPPGEPSGPASPYRVASADY